jgi:hypothetical protein
MNLRLFAQMNQLKQQKKSAAAREHGKLVNGQLMENDYIGDFWV